jgi:uncharacterized protein (TIGR02569 family)
VTWVSEPPPSVLSAFGLAGTAVRLRGGQGTSWRVGGVVLKPGVDPAFQQWLGTDVAQIQQRRFRLPAVCRATCGAWVVQGWGAQTVMPGAAATKETTGWRPVIEASRALHAATAALTRPALLDQRTDHWAWADRVAWGESPVEALPELGDLVARLKDALSPLGPAQMVHGDLTSNVLIANREAPSIIDFSPYWRPASYADGIIIADALTWHDAPPEIAEELEVPIAAVARGLLFRVLTASRLHHGQHATIREEAQRYTSAVDALNL